MKSNSQKGKITASPKRRRVCFEWHSPAGEVSVAGSFNGWNPEKAKLSRKGEKEWKRFVLLEPGTYEYLFVVDGEWKSDPDANGAVPNPFGGVNSTLAVEAA